MTQYPNIGPRQMGWECPKCGAVYSPTTPQCFHCRPSQTVTRTGVPDAPSSVSGGGIVTEV